jgi:hypothetical protein
MAPGPATYELDTLLAIHASVFDVAVDDKIVPGAGLQTTALGLFEGTGDALRVLAEAGVPPVATRR